VANIIADTLSRRLQTSCPPHNNPAVETFQTLSDSPSSPSSPYVYLEPAAVLRVSHTALNDIKLRVGSAAVWVEEVYATLRVDGYFGQILAVLDERIPDLETSSAKKYFVC
jgi:hypothetical protein